MIQLPQGWFLSHFSFFKRQCLQLSTGRFLFLLYLLPGDDSDTEDSGIDSVFTGDTVEFDEVVEGTEGGDPEVVLTSLLGSKGNGNRLRIWNTVLSLLAAMAAITVHYGVHNRTN